jgi:lysophospholipase L1-like esterase
VRDVSSQFGVSVLEAAALNARPELFDDDCHLSPEGHKFQARMVYDALLPLISSE